MNRIYECDTDALFLHSFRTNPDFVKLFMKKTGITSAKGMPCVKLQTKHRLGTGSIDLELCFPNGPIMLIENKIDAGYSITRSGEGQSDRYRRSVQHLRSAGLDSYSVLLAPSVYLAATLIGVAFDCRVKYEDLFSALPEEDARFLYRATIQASTPYEPVANSHTMDFFSNYNQFVAQRFSNLIVKHNPNAKGVRPEGSNTIYFDVPRTLARHPDVPRPRMSLQCRDSGAPAASVKIMIGSWAQHASLLECPESLNDIGGYLRPAGRSLGIVIDTPHLDTQKPFNEQLPEIVDGLEAAIRLRTWWNENAELLQNWKRVLTG